jgi:hypothetical protein
LKKIDPFLADILNEHCLESGPAISNLHIESRKNLFDRKVKIGQSPPAEDPEPQRYATDVTF